MHPVLMTRTGSSQAAAMRAVKMTRMQQQMMTMTALELLMAVTAATAVTQQMRMKMSLMKTDTGGAKDSSYTC
jgi:hypothetical protein